jgi:hypothetical protein
MNSWAQTPHGDAQNKRGTGEPVAQGDKQPGTWWSQLVEVGIVNHPSANFSDSPQALSLQLVTWAAAMSAMVALEASPSSKTAQAIADKAAASLVRPLSEIAPSTEGAILRFSNRQKWIDYCNRIIRKHLDNTSEWRGWSIELQEVVLRDFNPSGIRKITIPFDWISLMSNDANIELSPELHLFAHIADATKFILAVELAMLTTSSPNFLSNRDQNIGLFPDDFFQKIQFELPRIVPGMTRGQMWVPNMGTLIFNDLSDLPSKLDDALLALQHIVSTIALHFKTPEPVVIKSSAQILK